MHVSMGEDAEWLRCNRMRVLRVTREVLGLSPPKAAAKAGISYRTIHRWEAGERVPDRFVLTGYLRALGLPPSEVDFVMNQCGYTMPAQLTDRTIPWSMLLAATPAPSGSDSRIPA